ncbi:A/G-specific adenine glycosylase [Staphylococcus pettenkoferi]|uniref:Adenine DNA glycosylase n=1 Tax=Staphylococcus pettenkoferi TaxID=170573 RepID=A0A9Q4D640_9STAP|nr:A/G-specific adenine glycosylase [Staphylococcus pettenkoferi]MCY1570267.1 A/G-specific adenine glycosylase [Staphylococcus pettenkoferi]MCY1576786.1 A/G-specific adenine glycosylase [Staphylococcus pettenkoferi]MCY1595308.1 A/G-specific adenine glycosylase [Staphylococcus pettenkoferi]MCY1618402.1 A/G-specific adenine glycosylase [Staphylococcus pettenkoferi]
MLQEATFKQDLLEWFDANQREMPWRETSNPYYIWLSEVMLQQTQVNTVRDYYRRFIERFPNIEDLSEAREDEVLKLWEGLGYYSRARNFHQAAKEVHHTYQGTVPRDPEDFKALKGVGPYTQAAVMSIAFDYPLPTVDGNVFRVWSRLNNDERDTKLQSTRKAFEQELQPYVESEAGQFNQAMMELGALVCTPKSPLCLFCPVQEHCSAFHAGTVLDLPVKTKKVKKKTKKLDVFLIVNEQGELLIEQRQEKLLNGMWEFPMYETNQSHKMHDWLGGSYAWKAQFLTQLKHQFTHLTWDMSVYVLQQPVDESQLVLPENMTWMPVESKDEYNFPVSMTKIFKKYLSESHNR